VKNDHDEFMKFKRAIQPFLEKLPRGLTAAFGFLVEDRCAGGKAVAVNAPCAGWQPSKLPSFLKPACMDKSGSSKTR
jgi:hypothetical protein